MKIFTNSKTIIIVLLLYLSVFIFGCSKKEIEQPQITEVKYMTVVQKNTPIKGEWVGQTIGAEDIDIRSRVDGILKGIYFNEGRYVEKGTLLYVIDAKDLEQNVANAKSKLSEAKTMLSQAEADVKRYTPLAEAGAVSQRTLEIAVANYDARKSDVESALALLKLAEIDLGYSRISAPISGIIGLSNYKPGDYIAKFSSGAMNTISNVDPIHVKFSISEQEYLDFAKRYSLKGGKDKEDRIELEMTLADGSLYEHTGTISFAQRQVDISTGTLQFEASFPNPDRLIRPGQFAKISTVVEVLKDAILIPNICITDLQGQLQVFVVSKDNKVQLRVIKTGPKYGQFTVVLSGIKPGEKIITEGFQKVRPEMIVKPIDESVKLDSLLKNGGS
jgi:membrane fusion protein, multidrug efflux system